MSEKSERLYYEIKDLPTDEICWIIRNVLYDIVSYWDEGNKGRIFSGDYNQKEIECATRLQQSIRNKVDIFNQVLNHREFEDDYFEDILTDGYYSRYKNEMKKSEMNDDLCN